MITVPGHSEFQGTALWESSQEIAILRSVLRASEVVLSDY